MNTVISFEECPPPKVALITWPHLKRKAGLDGANSRLKNAHNSFLSSPSCCMHKIRDSCDSILSLGDKLSNFS